ncbi:MAG: caspase family protein [Chitinophagaceae bacterium]|nr:caspase family protein [Chitinophagaceae bacterium]
MRRCFLPSGLLLLMLAIGLCSLGQTKRALLIGVSQYSDPRWKSLSSDNDIRYLRDALQLQRFQPAHIMMLTDAQATHAGIRQAFEQLTKTVKAGDIVYIHFSGHGQQIEDDKELQDEADGYDEALVPYDARGRYDPVKYQGQLHFRDDLLGKYLESLRKTLGAQGSLLVVIDACHSGTATRSSQFAIVRGDPTPFANPEYVPRLKAELGRSNQAEGFMSSQPLATSNMVVFSASSPNQVNYETHDAAGKGVGSLSYALARALQRMDANTTYGDLFRQVKSMIQADYPQQLPMMEGDDRQQVFGGQYLPRSEQQVVDHWTSDTSFVVNMGQLQGIYPGTVLKLQHPATRATLGSARVVESDPVNCTAVPTQKLDKSQPYAVVVESYGTPPVQLGLKVVPAEGVDRGMTTSLEQWAQQLPGVSLSAPPDLMLAISKDGSQTRLELVEAGDAVRWQGIFASGQVPDEAGTKAIQAALQAYARTRFLRSLPDGGPLSGKIELRIEAEAGRDASAEWKLNRGSLYKFIIVNNSDTRVYFNLLNILPTNQTHVLLPQPGDMPQDYSIGAGQSFEIPEIMVDTDAAAGKEWLKVVCSARPLDLRPVFDTGGSETRTRSVGGDFEQWLNESLDKTNSTRTRSAGAQAVTVVSTGFTVMAQ